jgi:hypothetical protein
MTDHDLLLREFANLVIRGEPLDSLVIGLRGLRDAGISATAVSTMLEELRVNYKESSTEDRILEILDFVTGFCPREQTIWPDD